MAKVTDPPIPMVMAHDPSDRDLVPLLGCQRILNPYDHVEDMEQCGKQVSYLITDTWFISVLCTAHAAEFRAKRPEWFQTMSSI